MTFFQRLNQIVPEPPAMVEAAETRTMSGQQDENDDIVVVKEDESSSGRHRQVRPASSLILVQPAPVAQNGDADNIVVSVHDLATTVATSGDDNPILHLLEESWPEVVRFRDRFEIFRQLVEADIETKLTSLQGGEYFCNRLEVA